MRDALVFPLYDGGNTGVRRRQLHDILRQPGYHSMLAAEGSVLHGQIDPCAGVRIAPDP